MAYLGHRNEITSGSQVARDPAVESIIKKLSVGGTDLLSALPQKPSQLGTPAVQNTAEALTPDELKFLADAHGEFIDAKQKINEAEQLLGEDFFSSALASPQLGRFGKLLGVDGGREVVKNYFESLLAEGTKDSVNKAINLASEIKAVQERINRASELDGQLQSLTGELGLGQEYNEYAEMSGDTPAERAKRQKALKRLVRAIKRSHKQDRPGTRGKAQMLIESLNPFATDEPTRELFQAHMDRDESVRSAEFDLRHMEIHLGDIEGAKNNLNLALGRLTSDADFNRLATEALGAMASGEEAPETPEAPDTTKGVDQVRSFVRTLSKTRNMAEAEKTIFGDMWNPSPGANLGKERAKKWDEFLDSNPFAEIIKEVIEAIYQSRTAQFG